MRAPRTRRPHGHLIEVGARRRVICTIHNEVANAAIRPPDTRAAYRLNPCQAVDRPLLFGECPATAGVFMRLVGRLLVVMHSR